MLLDRWITNDAINSELGISDVSVNSVLHDDLKMHRVSMNMHRDMIDMAIQDGRLLEEIAIGKVNTDFFTTLR